ncbi:DNA methylase [Candidatus Woesearchaeota archaeon CG10_big_fil_rev_8_21_14_0_10_34_8]|nr:MAG: DNA methylase [Candidatus Woesearchaeota archaeon CG10_big_fil_rev_8_21_14_0_10_34_8]
MPSKKQLAIQLSRLKVFNKPNINLEQYPTNSEIASTILWDAYMKGDIENKTIADLGAGTGILGIGALLLGAKKVYFIEKDKETITILEKNLENIEGSYIVINEDIKDFDEKVDTVLQNPPFGTKQKHADKSFLEKAFSIGKVIYSFHKTSTDNFVRAIARDFNFNITETYKFNFPLRQTAKFHKKKIERIEVSCYKLTNSSK